jgi:hypothetical protein
MLARYKRSRLLVQSPSDDEKRIITMTPGLPQDTKIKDKIENI